MIVSLGDISEMGLLEQEFDLVGDRSRETHYYSVIFLSVWNNEQ